MELFVDIIKGGERYKLTGVNLKEIDGGKGILIREQRTGKEITTLIIEGYILTGVPKGSYEDPSMPGCFFDFSGEPINISDQSIGVPDIAFLISHNYAKKNNLLGGVYWTDY